jgi:hypothetical protein
MKKNIDIQFLSDESDLEDRLGQYHLLSYI